MQPEPEKLFTLPETADILGRHVRTVMTLVNTGELAAIRIGPRGVRFDPKDVQAFIDAHRVGVV